MGESATINLSLPVLIAAALGMMFLAIVFVLFFVVYQRRLFRQQQLIVEEERRHQLELLRAAVEIQETERRRIARDLHDDIGSLLSAARLYLKQLSFQDADTRNASIREDSLEILDEMIGNTRRITHDLMPAALEKFGFFAATQDLAARISDTDAVRVIYRPCTDHRLPPTTEVALYRVIQELTTNTLKHAQASQIDIGCEWTSERLYLTYSDNGKGFEIKTKEQRGNSGLGLRNIESRISLIGGSVETITSPGNGLSVSISLPNPAS